MVEVRRVWKEMSRDIILNCWIHTGLLDEKIPPEATVTELEDRSGIEEEVEGMVNRLVGSRARISIANFLNPSQEDEVTGMVTVGDVVSSAFMEMNDDEEADAEGGTENGIECCPPFTIEEQLKALAIVKSLLEDSEEISPGIRVAISRQQRILRGKNANSAVQTTIDTFFK